MLSLDELLSKNVADIISQIGQSKSIILGHLGKTKTYNVLNNENELLIFLTAMLQHDNHINQINNIRGGGPVIPFPQNAIVTFDLKNMPKAEELMHNCVNLIFLKKVQLERSGSFNYIYFSNCIFQEYISIGNQSKTNNLSVSLEECRVNKIISINGNAQYICVNNTKFNSYNALHIHSNNIKNIKIINSDLSANIQNCDIERIHIDKCDISHFHLYNINIKNKFTITDSDLKNKSNLLFNNLFLEGYGKIRLNKPKGKINFNDVIFNNLDFNFEDFESTEFECFKIINCNEINHTETSNNFRVLYEIAKKLGDNKYYLRFEYLEKKHKLMNKMGNAIQNSEYKLLPKLFLEKIIEFIFGYFCSWKRMVCSIVSCILFFSVIYTFYPDKIEVSGATLRNENLIQLISNCTLSISQIFEIYSQSLYLSIITFATVGFGDISPKHEGLFKFLVAFEGLLGVILIAFLTATIIRRFTK